MVHNFSGGNNASGILYAEDFDRVLPDNVEKSDDISPPTENENTNTLSDELLEESYQRGLQEGKILGKEAFDNEKISMESFYKNEIRKEIDRIFESIKNIEKDISKQATSFFLKMLVNLFPELLTQYGVEEAKRTIEKINSYIKDNFQLELTCSQEFSEKIEGYFGEFTQKTINIIVDEAKKGGDFKVSWDTGLFVRNADKVVSEITSQILSLSQEKIGGKNAG
ncbi:hypothetical protein [Gluconobacter oxydans]|uniref:Flagellar assembly protein FliH/Type III secretion system HrpE domain-containing protein n=1 Tax=Gluconobacter oxydans TaxID=442 RepID=A0AB35ARY4_GLUOY|nr:hypothetical protein [Gluconobacter oxydans]KXV30665.1 hypothetical protein AD939_10275 [Gluconobacter oxydans]MBF0856706.1 hypothetical protein [Gluconobacter oxydans]TCW24837.1 hypothetical protein EDC20_1164 [Gluconobacter oxydans]GEC61202.1 hypothetical protein GOX01_15330 [Gluconobacter oxydans]